MNYWNEIARKVMAREPIHPQQETISILGFIDSDTNIRLEAQSSTTMMSDEDWVNKGYFECNFTAVMNSALPKYNNHRALYDLEHHNHVIRDKRFNESKLWVYNIFEVGDLLRQGHKDITIKVDISDYISIKTARAQKAIGPMCSVNAYLYCHETDQVILQERQNTEYENGVLSLFGGGNTPLKGDGLDLYIPLSREVIEETQGIKLDLQEPLPSLQEEKLRGLPWVLMTENFLSNGAISGSVQFNTIIEITKKEVDFFNRYSMPAMNNNFEGPWRVIHREDLLFNITKKENKDEDLSEGFSAFTLEFLRLTLSELGKESPKRQPISSSEKLVLTRANKMLSLSPSEYQFSGMMLYQGMSLALIVNTLQRKAPDIAALLHDYPLFVFGRSVNRASYCDYFQHRNVAFYEMLWFDLCCHWCPENELSLSLLLNDANQDEHKGLQRHMNALLKSDSDFSGSLGKHIKVSLNSRKTAYQSAFPKKKSPDKGCDVLFQHPYPTITHQRSDDCQSYGAVFKHVGSQEIKLDLITPCDHITAVEWVFESAQRQRTVVHLDQMLALMTPERIQKIKDLVKLYLGLYQEAKQLYTEEQSKPQR